MRPWLRKVLGVCCIIGGILFGIFPFVPGVLLVVVGLEFLGIVLIPWDKVKWSRRPRKWEEPTENIDNLEK